MPKRIEDLPPELAKKIEEDAKAREVKLKPIKDELDKLPPNHTKEEAFEAFMRGVMNLGK